MNSKVIYSTIFLLGIIILTLISSSDDEQSRDNKTIQETSQKNITTTNTKIIEKNSLPNKKEPELDTEKNNQISDLKTLYKVGNENITDPKLSQKENYLKRRETLSQIDNLKMQRYVQYKKKYEKLREGGVKKKLYEKRKQEFLKRKEQSPDRRAAISAYGEFQQISQKQRVRVENMKKISERKALTNKYKKKEE